MKTITSKEHRPSKNEKAFFTSMEDLRENFNLKPVTKQTHDTEKLDQQRKKFVGTCKVCHSEMQYVQGTNILICPNTKCKGIVMNVGTEYEEKKTVTRLLDEKGFEIAQTLFR